MSARDRRATAPWIAVASALMLVAGLALGLPDTIALILLALGGLGLLQALALGRIDMTEKTPRRRR